MENPDIYQYDNYRLFLADCFQIRKKAIKKYTYRKFAEEAGIKNPGFLNDVIKGRRDLSLEARIKFGLAFQIQNQDFDYFSLLVEINQCKDHNLKEELYSKLAFRRSRSKFAKINPALVRYYQDYRYPLIRSGIESFAFHGNFEAFAKFFRPALPVPLVKKVVADLLSWGLVLRKPNGLHQVTQKFIEPSHKLGLQVRELNKTWFKQSIDALDLIPPEERHISTVMINISQENKQLIQKKILQLREEIFTLAQEESSPSQTMQVSLAYFPRTKPKDKS